MSQITPRPRPPEHLVHKLDGNVLAGVLQTLGAAGATDVEVECGTCGRRAPLAQWSVEADRTAFIVRCRDCTHTLATILRDADGGLTVRIAGGPTLRARG
ncbi:DUF6510 family protein [Microbacterium sp. 1P10UB]|uniref:DUF6510 family protein n=1 Tax=unclassified Microbacterium TaxID=2609290 RepID=UPI00399FC2CA